MSDNNGWPDPARPGVPLNPETYGAHQLGTYFLIWRPSSRDYINHNGNLLLPEAACAWTYKGPFLTPAEVEARVADARRNALEEAVKMAKRAGEHHEETGLRMGITPTIGGATETICLAIDALSDTPLDDPKRIESARKVFGITAPAGKGEGDE